MNDLRDYSSTKHILKKVVKEKNISLLPGKFYSGAFNTNIFYLDKKGEITFWFWGFWTTLNVLIR